LNDARPAGDPGLLEVHIERKTYGSALGQRVDVLRDLRFALPRGEVGVLVGPSGCGKTTILRLIAGSDSDYEGTIVRPAAGKLAMVFQEPRLLPWRTVEDNVRLIAPHAEAATLTMLFDVLELDRHRAHYPGELSLGLARRVALARAFATDPDLLLLDEPFVSLDEALARRLQDELILLVEKRAVTTLLVTHDVDEAARLGDRLFLLSPRPAHVVAELPMAIPRRRRGTDDIAAVKADVARRIGNNVGSQAT
jgi:ABC-type nitrate/sulfonate/bicarbonate transport system ATPase subunit